MSRPTDETLLAFLEGRLARSEREAFLDRLDADPRLARELRDAAAGLELLQSEVEVAGARPQPETARRARRVSRWWAAAAASVATLLISVPATLQMASRTDVAAEQVSREPAASGPGAEGPAGAASGRPETSAPSFVLVLHGTWPDASEITGDEAMRRSGEYWDWVDELAGRGVLMAAGDLRWEPGERLGPEGVRLAVQGTEVTQPDYLVGMFALRAGSYEEAMALAEECPHLRHGGTISIRRVAAGFVTVPGMSDWSD